MSNKSRSVQIHPTIPFDSSRDTAMVFLPPQTLGVLSDHVVGSSILLPGVGYLEFALESAVLAV